ncbi:UNVERIFIED_CONTAM: protein DEFECTIVE IN MERISTEM SILENCING 3 [Sesamum angustifolium]|uniref:Protein DEFECTIVE IN MERISTEM SILENCING 3 n=1 Tax=Sesamum angustifolium TaxID=2727405 RepID=A0AAW2PUW1_9LAMI
MGLRLFSEYLGLETMLAVVCKTYEGVKALEAYNKEGSIDKSSGLHAFAASIGRPLTGRFLVICLEDIRPYSGEIIADDPQRRLTLLKPRLLNGEHPPGFLGFAVNMITIDSTNLYCFSKTGHSLRETLFNHLFTDLQVYRSREDMLNALSCIRNGAISLDGGMIRSRGVFSLGHHQGDIDVKFPSTSQKLDLPESYFEIEVGLKETKWKKDRAMEDMQREQALLAHARVNYETRKREFLQFLARSSSHVSPVIHPLHGSRELLSAVPSIKSIL